MTSSSSIKKTQPSLMSRRFSVEEHEVHEKKDPYFKLFMENDAIGERTKQTYICCFRMIKEQLNKLVDFEWIACHPNEVIGVIKAKNPNIHTKHAMLTTVRALFKYGGNLKDDKPECYETWGKALSKIMDKVREEMEEAKMTPKQDQNWVTWKEVLEVERRLAENPDTYGGYDHLLVAMYCLIEPLRQNFGNVKIHHATPSGETATTKNFIVITPAGKGTLVLNDYKTSHKYGRFSRELPDSLVKVIQASLEQDPRDYLFIMSNGEPYTKQNSFTSYSNRTFKKLFNKGVTVSLLRHSFISSTDFNEATPKELIQKAKNMTHSMTMQQMYRRKLPTEKKVVEPVVERSHHQNHSVIQYDHGPSQPKKDKKKREEFKIIITT